jgi:hypothetical protein
MKYAYVITGAIIEKLRPMFKTMQNTIPNPIIYSS